MKNFIPNIDDANTRIMQLAKERGIEHSEFIPNIDDANDRVGELERMPVPKQPASKASLPAGQNLTGLRRAVAANGGGVQPRYNVSDVPVKGAGLQRAIAANQAANE